MKTFSLSAEPRKITGKKVKKLRREGVLPANVYGKDIKSQSIQLPQKDFDSVFKEAGETGLVELKVGKQTIPTLIHNTHKDYRGNVLHVDFFKVNLKEKVKAQIPFEFVGEPLAETEKIGLLMEITHEIEVEALPTDLPEKIEVNVEDLAQVDDQILVSDIKAPQGVEVLSDPNQVVVKIGELVTKEAQALAEEEAAAAEAAAGEAAEGEEIVEGAEGQVETQGEAPQAGEVPSETPAEGKSEEKPKE